jgi:hypothetical protein
VLADVNNDTKMEIIFLFERQIAERTFQAEAHVWKADGSELPGWPKEIPVSAQKAWNRGIMVSPAVGDLDGDGRIELIVPISQVSQITVENTSYLADKLFAWHGDGSEVSGWPLTSPREIQTLAVGDLDGDLKEEVVLNLFSQSNFKSIIEVLNGDGNLMPGWPTTEIDGHTFSYAQSGFALGDINNDNKLEIVANMFSRTNAGWGIVYAWGYDGKIVSGWPQSYAPNLWGFWGSSMPVISDIDADGQNEVILSTGESSSAFIRGYYDSRLFAWHGNGSAVASFPKESMAWVLFNPSLGDMDGDGRAELLMTSAMEDEVNNVNWAGQLFALTFPGRADSIEWGTLGCNAQRTSRHVRNNE